MNSWIRRNLRSPTLSARTLILLLILHVFTFIHAEPNGAIHGKVVDHDGLPVAGARVELMEARTLVLTDAEGRFRFEELAPGHYHLRAETLFEGRAVADVDLAESSPVEVRLTLHVSIHREEIIVSASPTLHLASEVYQPVDVLSETELATKREPTLGETLSSESGVSTTYFGPGASRPVIRGMGADRSRVLESGIDVGDVSGVSPDHAVSLDTSAIERVEIVRGPATLLYGSGAVGGVINVLDGRIPEAVPARKTEGNLDLGYGANGNESSAALSLGGGAGGWAWHLGGSTFESDDYEIPAPVEEHDEPPRHPSEEPFNGKLENSDLEKSNLSAGLSRVWNRGFFGAAFTRFETKYGVPGGHEHHHEEPLEPARDPWQVGLAKEDGHQGVRIDLQQQRFDLKGELRDLGPVRTLKLRAGITDYEHAELEGDEIGTLFQAKGWEARIEAVHQPLGKLEGSVGVQLSGNDLEAIGLEAFIEPNQSNTYALFAYEELPVGRATLLFGARAERSELDGSVHDQPLSRSFSIFSASTGINLALAEHWSLSGSIARAARAPNAEELFSFGEHAATRSFEIGDPDLQEEVSHSLDVTIRRMEGRISGELSLFISRFDDFIYEHPTEDHGLPVEIPVYRFEQDDAQFSGAELHLDVELFHHQAHRLALELGADSVRAERRRDSMPLPFIPPFRSRVGLRYSGARWWASAGAEILAEQDRVFCEEHHHEGPEGTGAMTVSSEGSLGKQDHNHACEQPTAGYTLIGASIGYRFSRGRTVHELIARGKNLSDRFAQSHTSRLKEFAPLPGRALSLIYRLSF